MAIYNPPLRDMQFILTELAGLDDELVLADDGPDEQFGAATAGGRSWGNQVGLTSARASVPPAATCSSAIAGWTR
mgnify:CR=1 FL=1